jgi:hypothetical protein
MTKYICPNCGEEELVEGWTFVKDAVPEDDLALIAFVDKESNRVSIGWYEPEEELFCAWLSILEYLTLEQVLCWIYIPEPPNIEE